jgi:hypothetical protein
MPVSKRIFILITFAAGLLFCLAFLYGNGLSAALPKGSLPADATYRILAWNDLGMHCISPDFSDMAVLPPYNNLWAQVIQVGDPPKFITSSIQVTYVFTDNTFSVGKTNFWSYAQQLFNLPSPLPDNIGLKGKGLSGTMDLVNDHFIAEGIPLTEYSDSAPTVPSPYQLAQITVKDSTTQAVLAQSNVVAPVSSELHCDNCHSDDGDATVKGGIMPTGKVEMNILSLHDKLSMDKYPTGHTGALMDKRPVLCAECHASNALGAPGLPGVPSLSNSMHGQHKNLPDITPDTQGCYNCHPGPVTQCLRDVMSQKFSMTCVSCHGNMQNVSTNPNPWLNEPRCDTCHGSNAYQNQALYRHSTGHGGLYCEACHDSTHATAPSREPNDAIKFVEMQGHPGTLGDCTVCHATTPTGQFTHGTAVQPLLLYIPVVFNP